MAASLRPAVSGATAKHLRRVTALHGAGLIVGAIVMSLVLALLGSLAIALGMRSVLLVPVGVAIALAAMPSIGFRLPQSRWQVPEYWRRTLDAGSLPVAYGAILGLGVFTAVVVGAFWVFVAVTLRYPAPLALIGWLSYALGRMTGFRLALQVQPLERIFLTTHQRRALIISTAMIGTLVAVA
jgi:hypothetical protein